METVVVFIVTSSNNGKVNNDDSLSSNPSFAVLRTFPLCKLSGDVQSTHTSRTIRKLLLLIMHTASSKSLPTKGMCIKKIEC